MSAAVLTSDSAQPGKAPWFAARVETAPSGEVSRLVLPSRSPAARLARWLTGHDGRAEVLLPGTAVLRQRISLPPLRAGAVEAAVRLQVERYIPVRSDEVLLSVRMVRKTPDGVEAEAAVLPLEKHHKILVDLKPHGIHSGVAVVDGDPLGHKYRFGRSRLRPAASRIGLILLLVTCAAAALISVGPRQLAQEANGLQGERAMRERGRPLDSHLRLIGIVEEGASRSALFVTGPDVEAVRVEPGGEILGWTVEEITQGSASLVAGSTRRVISLWASRPAPEGGLHSPNADEEPETSTIDPQSELGPLPDDTGEQSVP